ncbi:MAG: tetratricopeptide repeat protein [Acidiferrobacterales bacterium]|nr:tetratricopeptide repeat protein [Acidiferrobacterales bacterium]
MAELNWAPFDCNPGEKVRALEALFTKALAKRMDPDYLCALAVDIGKCAPLGSNQTVLLMAELVNRGMHTVNVWSSYGQALRIAGRTDEAIDAAKRGLELAPDRSDLLILLGKLYRGACRIDDAESLLRKAYEKSPDQAFVPLCEVLIQQGKIGEVGELIETTAVYSGQSTATKALSGIYGLHTANRDLLCMQNSDAMVMCSPEELYGLEKVASINEEISRCLLSHPALVFEPESTATSKGRQGFIGDVLPENLSKTVIGLIQKQVEQVIDKLPVDLSEDNLGKRASIVCWAVVLDDGGFQRPHIHPAGWISGVYYVSVPDTNHELTDSGSIVFGEFPKTLAPDDCSYERTVFRPKSGQMILFPSYLYHSTVPHSGVEPRICLSFDVALS